MQPQWGLVPEGGEPVSELVARHPQTSLSDDIPLDLVSASGDGIADVVRIDVSYSPVELNPG